PRTSVGPVLESCACAVLLSASIPLRSKTVEGIPFKHFTRGPGRRRSDRPQNPVTPNRNRRSREFGILGHVKSECPVTIDRNTHRGCSRPFNAHKYGRCFA